MQRPIQLELLAPARDSHIAIEAIRHGADAVYMGASSHGARSAATNSLDDISSVVDYAHRFNARVYITLNTLVYDNELSDVEKLIKRLYTIGADALIVQDLGILNLDIPPIALHASTQCDIRTPQKARFLQDAGFSQLVLPRELSAAEIAAVRSATEVPLEAFVHGALCVSYSGDCQASLITTGRSANRGCCAQICRLPYSLTDRDGNVLVDDRHLLSLRDMSRIDHLGAMIDAGISSFKIEGRLKDVGYVKNTVTAYRKALDSLIDQSNGALTRSSSGSETFRFAPDLTKSFNRGFTPYFIDGKRDKMAATESPKWIGTEIGTVKGVKGTRITLNTEVRINNGDGLGFFNSDNKLEGFRVNRCDGKSLFTAKPINIAPGTVIYRNHDKAWDDMLAGSTAERYIPIDITLRPVTWGIAVDITDSDGNSVTIASELQTEPANTSQTEARKRTFSKLGDTIYRLNNFDDRLGDIFIPASRLTAIRREAISALDSARSAAYRYDYRRPRICDSAQNPTSKLTYHDNVANRKAELFYRSCGVSTIEKALEVATPSNGEIRVMTTRYCLRHEMGQCLRQSGTQWRNPLYLQAQGFRFRLDFDCRSCAMHVIAERPDSCS